MLAPGTVPIRRHFVASTLAHSMSNLRSGTWSPNCRRLANKDRCAFLAGTHTQSRCVHSLRLVSLMSKACLGPGRWYATDAASAQETHAPLSCDTRSVNEFQSCLAVGSVKRAIYSYSRVRMQFTAVASTHTSCQDKRMRRRRLKTPLWGSAFADLRRFHLLLRKASLAKGIEDAWRRHLLKTLTCVIGDMRLLGLRIGATETVAEIYAYYSLGQFSRAIDLWRESVATIRLHQTLRAEETPQTPLIRHLFPQTHVYALKSAVELKNVNTVRDIYTTSMVLMKDCNGATNKVQYKSSVLALSWVLFPSQKCARSTAAATAEAGSDYPWDPSRLGHAFLQQLFLELSKLESKPGRALATRVLRYMIQALCLNGDCKRALLTYWEHLALQKGGYSTASEVLCEMVRGLSRHGLVNEAYEVLSKAQAGSRNIHVWNTYLDGLVRHPQKILKEYASRFYERFDDAVQSMRSKDGIEPDAVTWSMWMRACFLMGDWRGAYKCFRDQYGVMSTDVACWDTVIRGLFQFSSDEPHAVGWQLVEEFIAMTSEKSPNKDSRAVVAADSRIVETVLLHCFPRFNEAKGTPAYKVLSEDVFERVVVWIEANISPRRKIGHALVLGTLLKTGQIKAALAMHQNMIDRQLWPSKSINCMVAKALALAGSRQASLGSTASAIEQAEEFILRKVPKQHYAAAYLPLVKSAAQDRRYADMWILIDRHYPWVPKQGAALADTARPFPDADMYQAMLSATEAKGDWSENRRLLDKLRLHLDLVNDCGDKKPKKKMAGIYNHYIRKHV